MNGSTSNSEPIDFTTGGTLGRIIGVDTGRASIDVHDHELLTQVAIGDLVAVRGARATEHLIGIVDRVTRSAEEEPLLDEESETGDVALEAGQRDLVRIVLVGTYRSVDAIEKMCSSVELIHFHRLTGRHS